MTRPNKYLVPEFNEHGDSRILMVRDGELIRLVHGIEAEDAAELDAMVARLAEHTDTPWMQLPLDWDRP